MGLTQISVLYDYALLTGFCNLCSILGLLRIVVVITRPWTDLIRKCCIHRSKSLLKPRSSGISRFASCFDLLARSRLII